jgi:hypothetical protein
VIDRVEDISSISDYDNVWCDTTIWSQISVI